MTKQRLNTKQKLAIDLVLVGLSDREIAKRARVSRKTINTWRNHDEDFRALLAERRKADRERQKRVVTRKPGRGNRKKR